MTEVQICNRALSLLGHDRTITNYASDTTTEAVRCREFFPAARDAVLSSFPWEWAMASLQLSANTSTALPAACVRIVDARNAAGNPVKVTRSGSNVSAVAACTLRYVSNATALSAFPVYVTDAIVAALAYRLFGPMVGNPSGKDGVETMTAFAEEAEAKLSEAKSLDIAEHAYLGGIATPTAVTETDLANRALAIIGAPRLIRDISEDPSEEAVRCRQLLPMAERKVLSAHQWEFATKEVTASSSPYSCPADFLRLVSVRSSAGAAIYAKVTDGTIVFSGTNVKVNYVSSSVVLSKIPQTVQEAIVLALALSLVTSMGGKDGGASMADSIGKQYAEAIASAIKSEIEDAQWRGEPSASDVAKIDIANRALSLCGSSYLVKDFDKDTDPSAVRIRQLYPMALKKVMAARTWEFATKSVTASSSPYNLPADFLRLVSVRDSEGKPVQATISNGTLVFSGSNRTVKYLAALDISKAPSQVVEAIVYALAAAISPSFTYDDGQADKTASRTDILVKQYEIALADAIAADVEDARWRGEPTDPSSVGKLDIANRALALIGSSDTIKDYNTDTSTIAVRVRSLFPVALEAILSAHDWDFAAVEKPVVLTHMDSGGFARVQIPSDCEKVVNVTDKDGNPLEHRRDRDFLYVKVEVSGVAVIRYVTSEIELSSVPSRFRDAVTDQLAALLVSSMKDGDRKSEMYFARAKAKLADAVFVETDETAYRGEWENPFIRSRR